MAGTVRDNSLSGQIVANYRVGRLVGRGGMGAVYEAVHQYLGRRAALKVLHEHFAQTPELTARFVNEARAANAVQHPSVVSVFEIGQLPDGTRYILMEFLDGPPLSQRIRELAASAESPPPAPGSAGPGVPAVSLRVIVSMRLMRQLASALRALHEKGVIHRDLKPDNILIVKDPETPGGERAKLLDFGIAKFVSEYGRISESPFPGVPAYVKTAFGALLGTPMYMGPELWRGKGNVDHRIDIYSLGCIFFELLTGRPPYHASAIAQLMQMHVRQKPPPALLQRPEIPRALAELVHRMLAKEPADRPTTTEVEIVLERLLAPSAQSAPGSVPGDASTMLLRPGSTQEEHLEQEDETMPMQRVALVAKSLTMIPTLDPQAVVLAGSSSLCGSEPPGPVVPQPVGTAPPPAALLHSAAAALPSASKPDAGEASPGSAGVSDGDRSPSGSAQLIPVPQIRRRVSTFFFAGMALLMLSSLHQVLRGTVGPFVPGVPPPMASYPEREGQLQSIPVRAEVRHPATMKLLGYTPYSYRVSPVQPLSFVLCKPGYKSRHVSAEWDDAGSVITRLQKKKP